MQWDLTKDKTMLKETLKEEGNFVIIKLWAQGKTDYRVQENKYGVEFDWDDFDDLKDAEKAFDIKIEEVKQEEAKKKAEAEREAEQAKGDVTDIDDGDILDIEIDDGDVVDETTKVLEKPKVSEREEVLVLRDLEWNGDGKYVHGDTEELVSFASKKLTVDSIINNRDIVYSYLLNDTADEDEPVDNFFIQVDSDDNSQFSVFMELYKDVYPDVDVSFFEDISEPMECCYYYDAGDKRTTQFLEFLEGIASQTSWEG